MSTEAKIGLVVIGVALVGVLWFATGRRNEPLQAPTQAKQTGKETLSRGERVRRRLAELNGEYGQGNRRDPSMRRWERELPTPAVAGQYAAGAPAPENEGAVQVGDTGDDELDFEALRQMALTDPDPDNRIVAVWLLGSLDDQPVMPVLIQALSDSDSEVRMAAIESISEFDDPPIDALSLAMDDPDPEIRFEALSVAAEIDDDRVQPILAKGLDDPDEDVRSLAEGVADLEVTFESAPAEDSAQPEAPPTAVKLQ